MGVRYKIIEYPDPESHSIWVRYKNIELILYCSGVMIQFTMLLETLVHFFAL